MLDALSSTAGLVAIMFFIAALETVVPLRSISRTWHTHLKPNLTLMVMTFAISFALNAIATLLALQFQIHDLAIASIELLPTWAVLPAAIFLLDFFAYWAHRLMHQLGGLWKVHRVHHSDLVVDVTTAYRQHPIEGLWRFSFIILPAWLMGIPAEALLTYRLVSACFALLEHANIGLWHPIERTLSYVFVTPNLHKTHHSRKQPETDSNYGNIFSIHDRLFRTFTPLKPTKSVTYGLNGYDSRELQTTGGLLRLPFVND